MFSVQQSVAKAIRHASSNVQRRCVLGCAEFSQIKKLVFGLNSMGAADTITSCFSAVGYCREI